MGTLRSRRGTWFRYGRDEHSTYSTNGAIPRNDEKQY
jgi:hypothetical protein